MGRLRCFGRVSGSDSISAGGLEPRLHRLDMKIRTAHQYQILGKEDSTSAVKRWKLISSRCFANRYC